MWTASVLVDGRAGRTKNRKWKSEKREAPERWTKSELGRPVLKTKMLESEEVSKAETEKKGLRQ
jgi:hypothetical protein